MAAELFANNFLTFLTSGCSPTDPTISTLDVSPTELQGGQFRIKLDSEYMLVTAGQDTNTWSVTRGIEGSTPAAHSSLSVVKHIVTSGSLSKFVSDVSATPRKIDSTGASNGQGLLYDVASNTWKASPRVVTDDRSTADQDLLISQGGTFVRLAVGTPGQQLEVRSDNTLKYVDTPRISANAWLASPSNSDTANQAALDNARAAVIGTGGIISFGRGKYNIAGSPNASGMPVGINLDSSRAVTLEGAGGADSGIGMGTVLNYTGTSGSLITGHSSSGLSLDGLHCTYSDPSYQGNLVDLDWLTQNTISISGTPTSGTWTLTFVYGTSAYAKTYTTNAIAYNASAATIATAMNNAIGADSTFTNPITGSSGSLPAQVTVAGVAGEQPVLTGHTDSITGGTVVLNAGNGGGDCSGFWARNCYFGGEALGQTTIANGGPLSYPVATIPVVSTSTFPPNGTIAIQGGGFVTYSGTTPTSFTGCVWNGVGTVADGLRVYGGAIMARSLLRLNKTIDSNVGPSCFFKYARYGVVGMDPSYSIEIKLDTCRFSRMGIASILNNGEDWLISGGATEPLLSSQSGMLLKKNASFAYSLTIDNHWMGDISQPNGNWIVFNSPSTGPLGTSLRNNRVATAGASGVDAFVYFTGGAKPQGFYIDGGQCGASLVLKAAQNSIISTGIPTGGTWTLTFTWNGQTYTTGAISRVATGLDIADAMNTAIGTNIWKPIGGNGTLQEVDQISITVPSGSGPPTGGTIAWNFTWNGNVYTTAQIAYNASAATMQAALLAATRPGGTAFSTDAGAGAVVCTGGPLPSSAITVTFPTFAMGAVTVLGHTDLLTGSPSSIGSFIHIASLVRVASTGTLSLSLTGHADSLTGGTSPAIGLNTDTASGTILGGAIHGTDGMLASPFSGMTLNNFNVTGNNGYADSTFLSNSRAFLRPTISALTDGATITPDITTGNIFTVTPSASRTMAAPIGTPHDGQKIIFRIKQPAAGGPVTITWTGGGGGFNFSIGIPTPNLSTGAGVVDYVGFTWNAAAAAGAGHWDCIGFVPGN